MNIALEAELAKLRLVVYLELLAYNAKTALSMRLLTRDSDR